MIKKKKILSILPSTSLYGKERSNIEVYKILSSSESFDLIILRNDKASLSLKTELSKFKTYNLSIPIRNRQQFKIILYLLDVLWSNIQFIFYLLKIRPEIIFLNSEMNVYDFFIPLFLYRKKIIYRIGDIPAYPQLMGYRFNSFMWKKIVVNKVDTIVSISSFIEKEVHKTGRENKNDRTIYNYPPIRVENQNELDINFHSNDSLKIGYLGQILSLKGVHLLVDAAIELINQGENIEFVFAGDMELDSDYTSELLSKAQKSKGADRFHFIGEIENVKSFFEKIDILCVPTIWPEALGNVLVEAKQNSVPLIILPSGGMPELVDHLSNGYVCKDKTAKELFIAISFYLKNREVIPLQKINSNKSLESLGITYTNFIKRWREVFETVAYGK